MRGRTIAERMGATFKDWSQLPAGPLDTVVVVKYWTPQIRDLRKRCRLLCLDPLDCFTKTHPKMAPEQFWDWCYQETACDVMIATSPACERTMQSPHWRTVLSPHHADERIGIDWYDPDGPVVYAGGERFLGDERPRIEAACRELGREFVCRFDGECWKALKGAALSLCVRFGKERTRLNLECKPTVKVANAARAGLRVLSTRDSSIESLETDSIGFTNPDALSWGEDIKWAMSDSWYPKYPWTVDTHCAVVRSLADA